MTNNLTAQTAIEFENVLKNHITSSEGAQKVYLAVQPFLEQAKNNTIQAPVENFPSGMQDAILDGNIEVPTEVEALFAQFELLLEFGEAKYLSIMQQLDKGFDI